MHADVDQIKGEVLPLAQSRDVARSLDDIVVESDEDNLGFDFLRIQVKIAEGRHPSDEELIELLQSIEEVVSHIDQRTVSVRFDEAV